MLQRQLHTERGHFETNTKQIEPLFSLQYKLKSTAIVTTCSFGAFLGIGVYRNNEKVYDNYLMPLVQFCPPELCHRLAVLGFKFKLFPSQTEPDSKILVSTIFHGQITNYSLNNIINLFTEHQIFEFVIVKSTWNCSRI